MSLFISEQSYVLICLINAKNGYLNMLKVPKTFILNQKGLEIKGISGEKKYISMIKGRGNVN